MQKPPSRRFQGMLVYTVVPVLMILMAACASTTSNTGQSTIGSNTATTTSAPTGTQPSTLTSTPVAFAAGGISFIGPVQSITSNSLVMTAPDGQTYTMAITPQTEISDFGTSLPAVGTSVDMDSAVNTDGSFTATKLKPAQQGDLDVNVIAYTGVTTSPVGADRVLNFTVGTKSYTFTLPTTAALDDFAGNAQAIGTNVSVKVKVQFPANTVISVGKGND